MRHLLPPAEKLPTSHKTKHENTRLRAGVFLSLLGTLAGCGTSQEVQGKPTPSWTAPAQPGTYNTPNAQPIPPSPAATSAPTVTQPNVAPSSSSIAPMPKTTFAVGEAACGRVTVTVDKTTKALTFNTNGKITKGNPTIYTWLMVTNFANPGAVIVKDGIQPLTTNLYPSSQWVSVGLFNPALMPPGQKAPSTAAELQQLVQGRENIEDLVGDTPWAGPMEPCEMFLVNHETNQLERVPGK